ncbi:hypothetical protein OAN58_03290 [Paracoccaceae bacterium]|nr:hypothetical protein [Paracoccaceae bacterium]MDC0912402.1 hypothetical protein [Paracoccaceae bacterium]
MSINHMTITKVPCNSDRIYDAADLLTHFASDLEENSNAIFTAFGKVISGQDSGDLLALSMFQSMDDVEKSFERMDESDHFAKLQQIQKSDKSTTDIYSFLEINFVELALKQPFYITIISGYLEGITEAEFVESVNNVTSAFSDSGAITMRLAKCLIGARPDTYLFGVTFNSLSSLNENASALAQNSKYQELSRHFVNQNKTLLKFLG